MAVCPDGHHSASDDFCDVCGLRITAVSGWTIGGPPPQADAPAESCPRCGTPRIGRFCEACGYSYVAASGRHASAADARAAGPSAAGPGAAGPRAGGVMETFPYPLDTWIAVVGADRAYYEQVQAVTGPEGAAVEFPPHCAERRFQLVGSQMRIGRRSVSRGLAPEIDLTGPPADPGISRLHAVLVAAPGGDWAVVDPGSANGTLVNGTEITAGEQVQLHDGDRINLGAWTAITVCRG